MLISSELFGKLIVLFVKWYVAEVPLAIIQGTRSYAGALMRMFSVTFLLKTSIRPWKNMRQTYPDTGIQIKKILEAWSANMVARGVGVVIRLSTAGFGLLVTMGAVIIGVGMFLLWLGAPLWALLILIFL